MNRTAALDRDRAAPSSPASTANRMTATESLLPEIINDFFNKIYQLRTGQPRLLAEHFPDFPNPGPLSPAPAVMQLLQGSLADARPLVPCRGRKLNHIKHS